ncbi:sensor histidine kinase [Paenibacillus contaminans]|uniref:histidine kinase n=1 Tax=Paenibacillus contaminans TaxID=450362 RepID=A0A329MCJ3_9BACL|nr:histidine kinase [Paenibacillus contaminans]RAV17701.1 two-component sensor histidine kinase [Paenibacillus contaminans]
MTAVKYAINRIMPAKLKYRFFYAFILFVLVPLAGIQIYQFQKIENMIKYRISQLNHNQLEQIAQSFDEMKTTMIKAMLTLENDGNVLSVLQNPGQYGQAEREGMLEERFKSLQSVEHGSYMQYALNDVHNNRYRSYASEENGGPIIPDKGFDSLLNGSSSYRLLLSEAESAELWDRAPLFTLYSVVRSPNMEPIGTLRIRVDYQEWFKSVAKEMSTGQSYFIADSTGAVIARTKNGLPLQSGIVRELMAQTVDGGPAYHFDKTTNALINVRYLPSMEWYIFNQFPIDLFLGDLKEMQRQVLVTLYIMLGVFSAITLLISASVTRPLAQLQKKMSQMVKKNLNIHLPEEHYKGEVLALNQSFNRMVADIHHLVEQLKIEERQKEAIHSQMLLNQINPHFLLNTLNSIKWIAVDQKNDEIADICVALGKLLESGLNSELELIYLKDEIDLVKAYVYIQKYRYDQLFDIAYEVDPALDYALVPKLGLQTLVENAINHGFSQMESGGWIVIRAFAERKKLHMEVEDNGIGLERSKQSIIKRNRRGIGLANLRERYRLLFKNEAEVRLISLSQGTKVILSFPLLVSIPYSLEGAGHVDDSDR